jgi:Flp pilus assembly protein TadG
VVEFALVLVPLLLILLGTIDWGYYLYLRAVVADAARAGARAGSLNPNLASAQATGESAASDFLASLGIPRPGQELTVSTPTGPVNSVSIRVVLTTPSITGFTGLDGSGILPVNASAQATMRLEP